MVYDMISNYLLMLQYLHIHATFNVLPVNFPAILTLSSNFGIILLALKPVLSPNDIAVFLLFSKESADFSLPLSEARLPDRVLPLGSKAQSCTRPMQGIQEARALDYFQ